MPYLMVGTLHQGVVRKLYMIKFKILNESDFR